MARGRLDDDRDTDDGELMHRTELNPREREPGWRWHHPACLTDEDLLRKCELGTGRATGGPGGQHRNKVETQVFLRHVESGLESRADERRSQIENKRVALRRMRLLLATNVRTAVPAGPIGSGLWKSRVRGGRIRCNPSHEDFPSLLAEALDVMEACRGDLSRAGLRLEVTMSQLVKLIKDHPPAFTELNRARAGRGEHPLK